MLTADERGRRLFFTHAHLSGARVLGAGLFRAHTGAGSAWREARARLCSPVMTTQPLVILAHAPGARAFAADVCAQLKALGYAVDALPQARGARAASLAGAHRLVLLWSRRAARTPALRAAAKRAGDKLLCVRLDDAHPPAALGARAMALPRGRHAANVWRRLLARAPERRAAAKTVTARTSRMAGAGAALAMALVVGGALYASDESFAARVNQLAGVAQAHASDFMNSIKARVAREG